MVRRERDHFERGPGASPGTTRRQAHLVEGTGPEVRPRKACRRKRRRPVGLEGREKQGGVSQRGAGSHKQGCAWENSE